MDSSALARLLRYRGDIEEGRMPTQDQPLPTPGKKAVKPIALATFARMIDERTERGIATYGRPLETHNGRDAHRDAMEELVDAVQYVTQAALEAADLRADLDNARAEVRSLGELNRSLDRRVADLEAENTALAERVAALNDLKRGGRGA